MFQSLTSDDVIFVISLVVLAYGVVESIQFMIRDYCRRIRNKRTAK